MKITIPHIHKIEGEAGFWAKVTKTGKIEDLKIQTLLGLRQIEGILIGRRYFEVPIVVSRICGICPAPHIIASITSLEKALGVRVIEPTIKLRKLLLAGNIIYSHTLHLFFLSLPDFFSIENDLELLKKFKEESKAVLRIRNLSEEILRVVGGRAVHPITPIVGGFTKLPERKSLKGLLEKIPRAIEDAIFLLNTINNIDYPDFERESIFMSLFSDNDYPFYLEKSVKIGQEKFMVGNFYSTQIEEDLKNPPVKKVTFRGRPYMVGAIARIKNNGRFLAPLAREKLEEFKKRNKISDEKFFKNIYFNLFSQALEILHFLEISESLIKEVLSSPQKEERNEIKPKEASGLSAIEAPRGTLFHYYEIDRGGRIFNCNIITPTAQFLHNIEEDLRFLLPRISRLKKKDQVRKIRSLIRVYDPCISCATH